MALPTGFTLLPPTFNLTPVLFTLTDSTVWGAGGLPAAVDVVEWFVITAPDGTVWHTGSSGSPDILPSVSQMNTTIPIPTDINGNIQVGTYTIVHWCLVTGGVQPGTYSISYTVEYCNALPVLDLDIDVNIFCGPSIVATDETSYTTTAGTWTIVSRVITLTNAYNLAVPQNTTNVANGATATVLANIYPGQWQYSMEVTLTLTASGHTCTVTLIIADTFTVADLKICDLICCIRALQARLIAYKTSNSFLYQQELIKRDDVEWLYNYMQWNAQCGFYTEATDTLNLLRSEAYLNCTSGCGCGGTTPTPIVAMCPGSGSGTTYTFVGLNGLLLSANGTVVTGSLSQHDRDVLDNALNTDLVSSDGSVTFTPSTVPGTPDTTLWDLSVATGFTSDYLTFKINLAMNVGGVPTISIFSPTVVGTTFQAPTVANQDTSPIGKANYFLIDDFYSGTPAGTFKVHLQVADATWSSAMEKLLGNTVNSFKQYTDAILLADILDVGTGAIYFRIKVVHVQPISTANLSVTKSVMVQFLSWNQMSYFFDNIVLSCTILK